MTMHTSVCIICHQRPPEWSVTCAGCVTRMRSDLRALADEYALLDAAPSGSAGDRVSGTREAPLPVRLDVLSLVGPGSDGVHDEHGDQVGELPTLYWLGQWADDWRDRRGQGEHQPDLTITGLTGWLGIRLADAADGHPAIDEFARELTKQLGALRAANGNVEAKVERQEVGPCPQIVDGRRCSAMLWRYPRIDFVTCERCGGEWHRRSWPWLAGAVNERSA